MYIKYKDQMLGVKIRDVRDFELHTSNCTELDGSITHGATIYDGCINLISFLADSAIESLVSFQLDSSVEVRSRRYRRTDPIATVDRAVTASETGELAWFNSMEAAQSVMNRLSDAIAGGEKLFDLTAYGEDGRLK